MKKVLFGIIALSMAAFAANPGDKENGASVPVRVIAEVVKPANALVITDEAGTILDELLLDHKIVGGSDKGDSVIAKNFKVKVTGTDGAVDTKNNGNVTIALNKTTTTLTKVGSAAIPANQITSNLRLVNGTGDTNAPNIGVDSYEYKAPLSGGEHLGTITSTIAAGSVPTTAGSGAYDNKVSTDAMPTLTVTYEAAGSGK
ncbi:hypothetical protein [Cetobacterium sp. 2G large]|uniref:hypothetical protein n=1 Tax=Cetobacterium sp. 2G large TaxID=2759680 RepID=UPI00163CD02C|nr:hypothetical protein [Cetobacterium sp. 2G large]MBC2854527.1 hypothetical protein [Cetobacterium sp. 2G large]